MDSTTEFSLDSVNDEGNDGHLIQQENDKIVSDQALALLNIATNVVFTQTLSILGAVSNVINVSVFFRMGYSESINISLTALAVSDFSSCFCLIWWNIGRIPAIQQLDNLPIELGELAYLVVVYPHVCFVIVTKLLTAFVSIERCLCVTMPLKVKTIITKKRIKIFCVSSFLFASLPFIALYYANGFGLTFSKRRNRTLYGLIYAENKIDIERVAYPFINIAYSVAPFVVICLSTTFLVMALRKNSQWRKETTSNVSKSSTKEQKISKMVVTMCLIFIICLIPQVAALLIANIFPEVSIDGKQRNVLLMMSAVIYLFEAFNSSCNMFVYYTNSSAYRMNFDQLFGCKRIAKCTQKKQGGVDG